MLETSLQNILGRLFDALLLPESSGSTQTSGDSLKRIHETLIEIRSELEHIKASVDSLITVHYKTGIEHLRDAGNVDHDDIRQTLLYLAISEFTKASNLEPLFLSGMAQLFVGECYKFLGEIKAALSWWEKAYSSLLHYHVGKIEQIERRFGRRKRWLLAARV
jgi:tetratricopeptide (TPR) repeat protein